jgi:hypothetical protein
MVYWSSSYEITASICVQEALAEGVELEDVNRTALVRLKVGLEEHGLSFPYSIPPKNSRRERGVGPYY